ncbi:mechanosensitive ion channel family protein [Clostridium sp.]|uniref:mechanosensitive ion channel family protein n=1 Tax=Clostridium sp. TaxID=1506 RepID=UPI001B6A782D|nr:mechanosensitive ion channel family protein [Clostridium sp.]MBP3915031.1 mechanosensitive ion channel family protein [Clostridium sp.]
MESIIHRFDIFSENNILKKLIDLIDLQNHYVNLALKIMIKIIIVFFAMKLIIYLGNKIIDKFVEKQIKSKLSFENNPQKAITIGEFLKNVLKYIVYFLGILIMFSDVFSDIPIGIVSAGGFAVGLGAQSLVKDLINGFFVLFEDEYGVGDYVTINGHSGIVESIGIRTTILRDFSGEVHIIPNGNVAEITNSSKSNNRFIVDVDIAYEEDIEKACMVIDEISKKFRENNDCIKEEINVLGPISLNSSSITIRTIGFSEPLRHWEMERGLRLEILRGFKDASIEIPYPKTCIINEKNNL